MSETTFEELFNKFLGDIMTKEEIARFRELFNDDRYDSLREQLLEAAYTNKAYRESGDHAPNEIFLSLLAKIDQQEKQDASGPSVMTLPGKTRFFRFRYVAAAVLIIILGGYLYFFRSGNNEPARIAHSLSPKENLAPGGNRAILTLAGGRQIILDSTQNGVLSQQGNARVVKADSGLLTYKVYKADKAAKEEEVYNTITTPRGGQYQVILPDGTHAWLNSTSALTFPTSFSGKDRRVTLEGEGYFEVAKNDIQPFIVTAGKTEVTVLGTHFDIMAYSDERSVNTTLLEGLVKVTAAGRQQIIKPGYQARVNNATGALSSGAVEVNRVISWKNGLFDFKGADVYTIMRQVARWYDVDIEYKGDLSDIELSGMVSRRAYVPQLLKLLEATERVHFVTQGKKNYCFSL
jgi:hypothetical protein